ncbi:hypothetical protein KUH32_01800 [Thalassococcus sp. CAU 1522]|uniref:Prevent-host-death protein n=1 Tax=Thalassococcus arenae TaxID=2851652 RepID=A0ABS6N398_9RHOB|nr:hypothetical protein [Thalassococcus arenae]MBV2358496.1 hypothetical protein [Thalassococcus arenae]
MQSEFRAVPLTRFREQTAKHVDWVDRWGGHLWLSRHGRFVAGVVPFYQLELLAALEGRDETEARRRLEEEYTRFRAAKSVQARAEAARLDAGQGVGGEARTALAMRRRVGAP